jgi:glycosyltransferase involved in cell wall biosynthesis
MTDLVDVHHRAVLEMLQEVDGIVVLCDWARELLVLNGVDREKITLSRHGIDVRDISGAIAVPIPSAGPLRLAYLGRLDPIKGVDVLIRAIRSEPELPIRLDVRGVVQAASGGRHLSELQRLTASDPRITFLEPAPADRVVEALRGYHAAAVPSQCLETGPLVVLEAFAAGVPVIGSALGGIAELVTHERDGVLVAPPDQPAAWLTALRRLIDEVDLLPRLRTGIQPPRAMADVAVAMEALYTEVTKAPSRAETKAVG